jgi:cytochrome c biogenesis protein CcdA
MFGTFNVISLGVWQQPLLVGAWFGLLHALDADHLSTLSGLAVGDRSMSATGYAIRWACGHAATLGSIALLVIGLGLWNLTALSAYAEILVGILLVLLGLRALRLGLQHGRAGDSRLAYSHVRGAGLLMGALHGGAGSAAVLALIPLSGYQSGVQSLLYLASFSMGVAASALAFSAGFARLLSRSRTSIGRLGAVLPATVGIFAVATGGTLLFGGMHVG